jgi:hypothetical protein
MIRVPNNVQDNGDVPPEQICSLDAFEGDVWLGSDDACEDVPTRVVLQQALTRLKPKQQEIIRLSIIEQRPAAEVASTLGYRSVQAMCNVRGKALNRLRQRLDGVIRRCAVAPTTGTTAPGVCSFGRGPSILPAHHPPPMLRF